MTIVENGSAAGQGTGGASPSVPSSIRRVSGGLLWYVLPMLVVVLAFFLRVYLLPSVPFGWHPDEATKGLMARDVLAGRYFPVFFSAFTGREALYVYLEAAFFALFGEGMLAGRLLSAFVGVLTVAFTYAVGRSLFNRRVGLIAAGLLTVSLWHLIASRNGYRAVIQPLIQLPVVWLLFRGWREAGTSRQVSAGGGAWSATPMRGWWYFAAAGLFLGLTQYTYTAARFFPVFILLAVFLALLISPRLVTRRWLPLLLMFLVAAVVFLPLGVHFYQNPIDFYGRAAQISVLTPEWAGGDPWGRLWRSIEETVNMFTVWGDPNYRFNLAGRPAFGELDAVLFYLGLLTCLALTIREKGIRRLACVTLFLWMVIMLLPMTLSAEGLPYYQRAIGVLPAIYFFPALFLDGMLSLTERRTPRRLLWAARAFGWVVLALLLFPLTRQVYGEYFSAWHAAERNDDDRRVAMVYVADYLKREPPLGDLYLSTEYAEHPTLAFLAPERYDDIHWFNAQQSLPLPPAGAPAGTEAIYLLLMENPPQPLLLERAVGLERVDTGLDRFGRPVFEVYRWRGDAHPVPGDQSPAVWSWEVTFEPGDPQGLRHSIDLPVNFGGVMSFIGHDRVGPDRRTERAGPGEILEVVLYWRLQRRPDRDYSFFAHLLDAQSQIVGEYDRNAYPARFWREEGGELLLSYFPLQVKPNTPPGEYQLEIGVYHQPSGERLPIYDAGGEMVADRLLLRPVEVR